MVTNLRRFAVVPVSLFALTGSALAGFTPIALSGEVAPDTGGATFGNLLSGISVAANGDIVFWSTLDGVPSSANTGAFRVVDGVVSKIIQESDPAPGLGGPSFDLIGGPVLSDSGVYTISLRLDTGGDITFDNDWGLWADFGSGLTRIAQEGSPAPGLGGALFDRPGDGLLSANGDLLFFSRLKNVGDVNGDNQDTMWRQVRGEALELVAREGEAAPGIAGGVFNFLNLASINSSGDVLMPGTVRAAAAARSRRGGVIDFSNDDGLWMTGGSGLELVAREGEIAPGTGGATYGYFGSPQLGDSGAFAFHSELTYPGIAPRGFGRDAALFLSSGGAPAPVAFGDAPAVGAGGMVHGQFLWPRLNAGDDLVFGSYLLAPDGADAPADRGFSDMGIWVRRGDTGVTEKIAITGDAAPGTDGARFAEFASPVLGASGDVVFTAGLIIEGGVTIENNTGLWAYLAPDSQRGVGAFFKIARSGDEFEVAPGDVRTIAYVNIEGANVEAFEPSQSLNAAGQLGVQLGFTDGSVGIFLFQIPAPGAGAVLAMGAALAMHRRR
ncbi:MAG: hypothetical protein H6813_05030 [Phycisphaeraceae bacterium]|nr:hypothetical protein [Phycisphaeraceae bacterium]MCB9847747.1 hypothetical protein [Phycisphaeraceae bacterium]